MSTSAINPTYQACPTKRARRSKAAVTDLKQVIYDIVAADHPMTVRQIYYQLVQRSVIEKTEAEYQQTVVRLLTSMRIDGELPFHWIVDHTRRRQVTRTYSSIAEAADDTATFYRRSALRDSPAYIEIWVEKDALSGIMWDPTSTYDVPLLSSKGMPSLTFLHSTAEQIRREWQVRRRPSYIYQFGDHDPTGALIPRTIESRLREFCPGIDFTVERVALTERQIKEHRLPTRPTKRDGNRHAKDFEGESVELDALPPRVLKGMVREAIERHISPVALAALRVAERSERDLLRAWGEQFSEGGAA
ncbi:hypothetical protein MMSR116_24965 [Methylobacterium mesophilicum SR1.6/6]|uniref:DUF2399 domain-containing protein n=1 Tax=Methylobacterium mesophilicum SR1.6/6 TaxID=908290 RepID=A0A6B9FQ63_9HYPH|nr:hypothetical protein [Methylobacterium mesophilicum]QGY04793.1 hypothetical protein MMSR116_24965 [Methylobacterium mesophilicum SR1.6/6]